MSDVAEELVLVDGTRIPTQPVYEQEGMEFVEIPSNTAAQKQVEKINRTLSDLPDIPERMNTIGVVLSYHMFGLNDEEIAIAIGMRKEQIVSIKLLEAFSTLQEAVIKNMVSSTKGDVQAVIEGAAVRAANRISHLVDNAEMETTQLSAAKDMLDRGGHRPADIVEIRSKMENTLKIEHIIRSDEEQAPIIDVQPIEVIENGNSSRPSSSSSDDDS